MNELPAAAVAALSGRRAAILFAAANLLFLLVDVALAHSAFLRSRAELVPLAVSAIAGPVTVVLAFLPNGVWPRLLLWTVAGGCMATGVVGTLLHLGAESLVRPTLHGLVYSAPIIAPLSYAGLGVLLLAAEHLRNDSARGRAIELLAGLGLLGNFVLCLLDHARNGFWAPVEWVSVAAGAIGGVALSAAAAVPEERPGERRFLWVLLAALVATAVLGSALHLHADLTAAGGTLLQRFQYGAPIFAPMLFADLAVLGALGLLTRVRPRPEASER